MHRIAEVAKALRTTAQSFYGDDKPGSIEDDYRDPDPLALRALRAFSRIESRVIRQRVLAFAEA